MAEFKNMGGFWKADEGKKYKLSGNIEVNGQKLKCFMFKNERKTDPKHPDYNLSVEVVSGTPAPAAPAPSVNDVDF